jgi:hypothetical protein
MEANRMPDLGWIVQIATAISLLITAVAAIVTLREYRLKLQAEKRQQESSQAEIDLRMLKLFVEILQLAMARGQSYVSEKGIEQAFVKGIITEDDFKNPNILVSKLQACSFDMATGAAGQDAAIAAIPVLAERYAILRHPARAALESLLNIESKKKNVELALEELNKLR